MNCGFWKIYKYVYKVILLCFYYFFIILISKVKSSVNFPISIYRRFLRRIAYFEFQAKSSTFEIPSKTSAFHAFAANNFLTQVGGEIEIYAGKWRHGEGVQRFTPNNFCRKLNGASKIYVGKLRYAHGLPLTF